MGRISKFCFSFCLALIITLGVAYPALNQEGNQSDATNPNVIEIVPPKSSNTVTEDFLEEDDGSDLVNAETADGMIQLIEESQAQDFANQLEIPLYGKVPTIDEIAAALYDLYQVTGKKSSIIYVFGFKNELQTLTILPKSRKSAANPGGNLIASLGKTLIGQQDQTSPTFRHSTVVNREDLDKTLTQFRNEITNPRAISSLNYMKPAQQLYQWIIAPIEEQLQREKVDILVFTMDRGLRGVPIAALHDGKQFLVEKYGLAMVPSFGLTDSRFQDIRKAKILAMGSSEFQEQSSLPAVPMELSQIFKNAWQGENFLNEQFTVENFIKENQQQNFEIIHLATHGEFEPGNIQNSYIQFWNQKLNMQQLSQIAQQLGWNSTTGKSVELMVLSACRTALGDEQAELGFAGLAVKAGVKSTLASLWYVSDAGTLALMNEFYKQLHQIPNKAEALRQAQIAMIRGNVSLEQGNLRGSSQEILSLPTAVRNKVNLSHPYFWAAFNLIGNWN